MRRLHPHPVHRQECCCGSFVQEELSGDLVSWNREVTESSEVREVTHRVQACVARDHEVIIATFAEELKADSEGFPKIRHGEAAEHLSCHRTPKNRLTRSKPAVLRAKFKENLAKQNAESKKRSTMRETSAAEEQENRAESILEPN